MGNPHFTQIESNRIPMYTCGDYAWNPRAYDPARSAGQAILHLEDSQVGRLLLRDLVETYPGMLVYKVQDTGFNAIRAQYQRIVSAPHSGSTGAAYIAHLESLAQRMNTVFPTTYAAEKATLAEDIRWTKDDMANRYSR